MATLKSVFSRSVNAVRTAASNRYVQAGVALSMAGSAHAEATDYTSAITAAIAKGTSNLQITTTGVVTVAAIGFGAAMVISWLRK